jgi:hemolysin activation/secretion protein
MIHRNYQRATRSVAFAVACLCGIALAGGSANAAAADAPPPSDVAIWPQPHQLGPSPLPLPPPLWQPRAIVLAADAPNVAAAVPPSAGAIQRQLQPSLPLPAPPGQVLSLPRPSQQRSKSQVLIPVHRIVIHGNTLLPTASLEALVKSAEGQTMPLEQLEQVVGRITRAYHDAGYPLAYAYLPQQQIHDGEVTVDIVEPRYSKISVIGHSKLKSGVALRTVGVAQGQMIAEAPLTRGLILLSQTPGIAAHAVFSPGQQPQTSDLDLNVQDTPRLVGDIDVSNSGNKAVGSTLIGADGTFNDPFGYGSAISVNAMATPHDEARLNAAGFALSLPYIWNGLRAGAYGSFTNYHLGESFAPLNESGRADQGGVDATYPLILAPGRSLVARLDVLGNWLDQTSVALSTEERETIPMERLSLGGSYADQRGDVTQANLSLSHGDLTISEAQVQATDAAGPRTAGGFDVLALQLAHTQALPGDFVLQASASGQVANKNLDSSQKFYLGGPNGVIGYAVGDGGGDDGYLADLELLHRVPLPEVPGALRAGVLAQYGEVRVNHHDYAAYGSRNVLTEAAVGPKVTFAWRGWSLMAAYGWRVGSFDRSGAVDNSVGAFWLTFAKNFQGL